MEPATPQMPDVDLPGQQHDQPDLDIVVEPEPGPDPDDEPAAEGASADDPEAGNILIRPDNT